MDLEYNVYCDESCHLENDGISVMTLGATWCLKSKVPEISEYIKSLKEKHGVGRFAEVKWTKVSNSKIDFYLELVDYFFINPDLNFRALIIPDKKKLNHLYFNQTHDDFYYKMYYNLLKPIHNDQFSFNIYIDIKDTNGNKKVFKLHEYLCNYHRDFTHDVINNVQQVRSHEGEILPLTDLLLGAVTYKNRGLNTSSAKLEVIGKIEKHVNYSLKNTTFLNQVKFNIFRWEPNYGS